MTDGHVSGGPEATQMDPPFVLTSPNVPLDGADGARVGCSRSATGSSSLAHQEGQGLVEYGLILVIAAVVCVVSLLFFGDQLSSLLSLITGAV